MKYSSEAQHEAVMATEAASKAPGLYRSPLKAAAMQHIKQPRKALTLPGSSTLMPAAPKPTSTPSY